MGLLWGGLQSKTNSCAETVWELKHGRGGRSKKQFGGSVMLYNLLNVWHNAAVSDSTEQQIPASDCHISDVFYLSGRINLFK